MQFVIEQTDDGDYGWVLRGANGKVACVSDRLERKQLCLDAISEVQLGVAQAVVVDNTIGPEEATDAIAIPAARWPR